MTRRRGHGEGTIYQMKSGKWRAHVSLPDGRRVSKVLDSRREASQWLAAATKTISDGLPVAASRITVGQFLDRWLVDVVAHRVRPRTYESYESIVRVHLRPALGDIRLVALRPDHVQRMISEKMETGCPTAPSSTSNLY